MVGGEVVSSGVRRRCHIGLVWWSGGDAVIFFCMPTCTKGGCTLSVAAHSAGYRGGGKKGELVHIVINGNEYKG